MRITSVIGIILMICAMLAACGENTSAAGNPTDNIAATDSVETVDQSPTLDLHFSSMEEYIDYIYKDTDEEVFTAEYMTYKVYADEETLVYDFTYDQQYDNVEDIKEKIEGAYDPENESIQKLLSDLRQYIDVQNPKIKYIYRNNDGTIITEQVYE